MSYKPGDPVWVVSEIDYPGVWFAGEIFSFCTADIGQKEPTWWVVLYDIEPAPSYAAHAAAERIIKPRLGGSFKELYKPPEIVECTK